MTQSSDSMLGVSGGERKARTARQNRRPTERAHVDTQALREIPLFSQLDETILSRLALEAKVDCYEEGDVIFRQGDPAVTITIVLRGYVKLIRAAPNGDETLIGVRASGQTVSDAPSGCEETNFVSAEAVGAVQALKFPCQRFARLIKESPALCASVRKDTNDRMAWLICEIESMKAQNADQRLARFLLSLCPPQGERCRFRLPYDKRLIAAQLGVKQETLSRAFAKLRDYGVRTETRDVLIESVTRLAKECEQLGRSLPLPSGGLQARNDAA